MAALFADLTTLEWVYLALFCAGLIYALFLAVFGFGHGAGLEHGAAELGHGVDLGHGGDLHGVDLGHGGDLHGADLGHGADTGHGVEHAAEAGHGEAHGDLGTESHAALPVHVSPWNPLVIASFVGGVGGFGILGTRLLGFRSLLSLVVALPAGLVLAGVIFGLYLLLVSQAGGSSAATWQDIRGAAGKVLTPIPEGGLGEVMYVARGTRFTSPARSIDGRAIPKDTAITVLDIERTAVVVDVRYTD